MILKKKGNKMMYCLLQILGICITVFEDLIFSSTKLAMQCGLYPISKIGGVLFMNNLYYN